MGLGPVLPDHGQARTGSPVIPKLRSCCLAQGHDVERVRSAEGSQTQSGTPLPISVQLLAEATRVVASVASFVVGMQAFTGGGGRGWLLLGARPGGFRSCPLPGAAVRSVPSLGR